jgi:hypothetical protein
VSAFDEPTIVAARAIDRRLRRNPHGVDNVTTDARTVEGGSGDEAQERHG